MWAAAYTEYISWDESSAATRAVNVQELNRKEPFHSIMIQYFDTLQNRTHLLGPSAGVAGTPPVGIELAEVLLGLRYAAQHCPSATLLQPGGQVCRGLLARFGELVADMDDSHFAKAIAHVADLNWVTGA